MNFFFMQLELLTQTVYLWLWLCYFFILPNKHTIFIPSSGLFQIRFCRCIYCLVKRLTFKVKNFFKKIYEQIFV